MRISYTLLAGASALILGLSACGGSNDTTSDNPLLAEWDTPYGVPPFEEITAEDYMPAVDAGIEALRADIAAIVENDEAPTFENTIVALDRAGSTLDRVTGVFGNVTNTESTEALRALETEIYPMLTAEYDAIALNADLWERIKTVHEQRETLNLNEEDARLLELTHLNFVRAGADLPDDKKARLAEINAELSGLSTQFGQNLLAETQEFKLELTTEDDLAGLSDSFKAAIKVEGEDKWIVGLSRTPYETFMTQSENRALRKQLFDGYRLRASGGEHDNGPVLIKMAQLRAERAELLGYESHAHYQLETRMAKTPEAAEEFLLQVWRPGLEQAKAELADIQEMIDDEGGDFAAEGHDWWHYSEKIRRDRYAFDDAQLAPYFELSAVRDGAYDVAGKLFEITLEEIDVPVWNEVVTAYEVIGADGEHLGVFMVDMYARESKRGGAWMSTYRDAERDEDGDWIRPIVTNNMNLIRPPAGEPTLLRFSEVETFYHEFGHGLHGLLTQVGYSSFSGVDGPRDYTEFPAQILEHWASQTEVLQEHATHYETGEPIPMELVQKMREAANFNQGFRTTEFVAAALLDLRWHMLSHDEAMEIADAREFERQVLAEYGLIDEIEPRYRSQYFSHIFAGGYSAGYYAYLWSEILDADGFAAFEEAGDIYDPELAAKLKKWIYESGGLRPADELYRNFRGADPSIEPLLRGRGFDVETGETDG